VLRLGPALAAFLAAALLAAAPAPPASAKGGGPDLNARAWLLVDANDGQRLASSAPSRPLAIASATKLMTAYLALKELPLDRKLTAPQYDALPAESILGLRAGERIEVRALLYSLILASANDGAVTLAEGVSGSVPAFVDEMNATAQRLGLDDTSYTNPIGLDAPGNRSSARDLAALAERLMRDKLFRRIADSTEATIETDQRTISIPTRNTLLLSDPTLTGIKTGHTLEAGYVLVGSATRDDVDLISIVLGAPSESARDAETAELLDYGFSNYSRRTPVSAGEALAEPELADQDETLRLVADDQLRVAVRDDQEVATEVDAPDEVVGPIDRGEQLGTVTVTVDGHDAGSADLVAARSAEAATFTEKVRSRFLSPLALVVIGLAVILVALLLATRRGRQPRTPEERMRSHEERTRRRDGGDET
jgi:serine-type D-Ala-D-Ala carboxypeptidase (penicillin-binding protein 5/6)